MVIEVLSIARSAPRPLENWKWPLTLQSASQDTRLENEVSYLEEDTGRGIDRRAEFRRVGHLHDALGVAGMLQRQHNAIPIRESLVEDVALLHEVTPLTPKEKA